MLLSSLTVLFADMMVRVVEGSWCNGRKRAAACFMDRSALHEAKNVIRWDGNLAPRWTEDNTDAGLYGYDRTE